MRPASGKQLCRALEQAGWRLVRVRGSQHRYERRGFPPVTVPVHGTRVLKPRHYECGEPERPRFKTAGAHLGGRTLTVNKTKPPPAVAATAIKSVAVRVIASKAPAGFGRAGPSPRLGWRAGW